MLIKGLEVFRDYFKGFQDCYTLIGGMACHISMGEAGLDFRATKDFDVVLCAEAMDSEFVKKFWEFVKDGGYEHQEKSTGDKQFYRFCKPSSAGFPFMLELFSRKLDGMTLDFDGHLTPIPTEEDISSLSAILLDEDYYQCIDKGKSVIDEVAILSPEYILPFKMHAWLDLTTRKESGEEIDSRKIKKHRNDVFRMFVLLSLEQRVDVAESIKADMRRFVEAMSAEAGLKMKDFYIRNASQEEVLDSLKLIYQLD